MYLKEYLRRHPRKENSGAQDSTSACVLGGGRAPCTTPTPLTPCASPSAYTSSYEGKLFLLNKLHPLRSGCENTCPATTLYRVATKCSLNSTADNLEYNPRLPGPLPRWRDGPRPTWHWHWHRVGENRAKGYLSKGRRAGRKACFPVK